MAIYKLINGKAILFANISGGGGGEKTVTRIAVATPPTKTVYTEGDPLDLSGMVVNAVWSDGTSTNITSEVTATPANGTILSTSDTAVSIAWTKDGSTYTTRQAISVSAQGATPTSIYVASPPAKVSYTSGEALDLSGMVVKAVWSDQSETVITGSVVTSPANGASLSTSDTAVSISWTYAGKRFSASQEITVSEAATPVNIFVYSAPTKTSYIEGDPLDLTGMVVKARWSDGTETNITSSVTTSPVNGAVLSTRDTAVNISWTYDGASYTVSQAIVVNSDTAKIYGAEWDGTNTSAWTRTDAATDFDDPIPAVGNGTGSSPFDTIQPWAGVVRVTDAEAGELVAIPKYYYKWTRDGIKMKLQISSAYFDGSFVSPAHADRGDGSGERDVVYVGRYHCDESTYKSVTGVLPKIEMSRGDFRTNIHNIGSDIWQYDYAMFWTITMLYLVEFADWDSQEKIGYGCGNNTSLEATGYTDSMRYHTGTSKSSRTILGAGTQYRYIEGLWDNVPEWCDGIYFHNEDIYCIKNPENFSDNSGGTYIGNRSTTSGFIQKWINPNAPGFEYALYPSEVDPNEGYVHDECYYAAYAQSNYYMTLSVGGRYKYGDEYFAKSFGLFYMDGSVGISGIGINVGSRIQKLPTAS